MRRRHAHSRHAEYFRRLNYTLANEDSRVELEALPENAGSVLCVAGSGARLLPLIARRPARVTCVDVAPEQLYLAELRVEAVRALPLDEYLAFWGYPPRSARPQERREVFATLPLSDAARSYWQKVFDERQWGSILYDGRWERTFAKLARVNGALTREAGRKLFEARTAEEHQDYLRKHFPRRRWLLTLLLLGNPVVFNLMLYKGDFPRKNLPGTPYSFYRDSFDKLYRAGPARENFFLQIVFFGELRYAEGNPIECNPEVYDKIRSALPHCEILYRQGDVVDLARAERGPVDFVSLSDVPSYLRPPAEQTFLQQIRCSLAPGGRVVARYYMRVPERVDRTGYDDITSEFAGLIAREKVGVYRIEVLQNR